MRTLKLSFTLSLTRTRSALSLTRALLPSSPQVGFYFGFLHHYTRWLAFIAVPSLVTLFVQLMPPDLVPTCGRTLGARLLGADDDDAGGANDDYGSGGGGGAGGGGGGGGRGNSTDGGRGGDDDCVPWSGVDNVFVPLFAVFISTWSAMFLEYWKRYQSVLAFKWDTTDFEAEEPVRPEFHRNPATTQRRGFYTHDAGFMPLGRTLSPYYSPDRRKCRVYCAVTVTALFMVVVGAGTFALYAFRLFIITDAWWQDTFVDVSNTLTDGNETVVEEANVYGIEIEQTSGVVAALLNLVFIVTFNAIYRKVAELLTDWENHRTESEYENSLIVKSFCFQFVNSYISFFYIAFFRSQRMTFFGVSTVDNDGETVTLRDQCQTSTWWGVERPNDCMSDIFTQMMVVVLLKGWVRHGVALGLPWLRGALLRCVRRAPKVTDHDETEGLQKLEYEASLGAFRGTYQEYNEMAIQFGYLTMFASAAPWAACFCMLNNEIERRVDAYKMLYTQQRPRYQGAASIGMWYQVFNALTVAAIVVNCLMMGYTSTVLEKAYELEAEEKLWLVLLLEHSLLLLKLVVDSNIPDVPLWVRKTQHYQWFLKGGESGSLGVGANAEELAALREELDMEDNDEQLFT